MGHVKVPFNRFIASAMHVAHSRFSSCPELVTATQRIAAENPNVTAEVYDLNHFANLRERYKVMSVPCLVIDDGETVSFGKKNISQLLELLDK